MGRGPSVPSPRTRGEGRGEGAFPRAGDFEAQFRGEPAMEISIAQTRGKAPSPGSLRDPTSPRTRGAVSRAAVPSSSSREFPSGAVLGVLEHHAHGGKLVADAVGLNEVFGLAGNQPLLN
jgi:hypothetical protein